MACWHTKKVLEHDGTLSLYPRCMYMRCKIQHLHYTPVYPTLHTICPFCSPRGRQGGWSTIKAWLTKVLADSKVVAGWRGLHITPLRRGRMGLLPQHWLNGRGSIPGFGCQKGLSLVHEPLREANIVLWRTSHHNSSKCASNRPEKCELSFSGWREKTKLATNWTWTLDLSAWILSKQQDGLCVCENTHTFEHACMAILYCTLWN